MKLVGILGILALAACGKSDEPRVSLGTSQARAAVPNDAVHQNVKSGQAATGAQDTPQGALPAAARAALDSGNAQYRAGKFEAALASYRAAAKAAPNDAAPYFGIYMAANRLGRAKDAAEAQRMINQISGDTTAVAPHAMPSKPKPPAASP